MLPFINDTNNWIYIYIYNFILKGRKGAGSSFLNIHGRWSTPDDKLNNVFIIVQGRIGPETIFTILGRWSTQDDTVITLNHPTGDVNMSLQMPGTHHSTVVYPGR